MAKKKSSSRKKRLAKIKSDHVIHDKINRANDIKNGVPPSKADGKPKRR